MRTLYDSVTAADIPASAEMVAGYVDGRYRWSAADWARFPLAVKVTIAVFASTDDGIVLDVEEGASIPAQLPGWLTRRRAHGVDPTAYVNRSNWRACIDACRNAGVAEPHWWLAAYDNVPEIPAGTVAKQYANPTLTGYHYDLSSVVDFWPGVDERRPAMSVPQRMGQSADLVLHRGELGMLQAIYSYPDTHPEGRAILTKVRANDVLGRRVITVYPPTDPDADATMLIDAEPTIFVVDVLP